MPTHFMPSRCGFTLLKLMGVIAGITVVLAMLAPFVRRAVDGHEETVLKEILKASRDRGKPISRAWVEASRQRLKKAIRVGMTRGDLLKLCRGGGGLFNHRQRTYCYREFQNLMVDVEFLPATVKLDQDGREVMFEDPHDAITTISQPYIDWLVCN